MEGLDKRLKMEEVVPKMTGRKGSDAGQSRRRRVRSCRWCPQAQLEFSFRFIVHRYKRKKRLWPWQRRSRDSLQRARPKGPVPLWKPKESGSREVC